MWLYGEYGLANEHLNRGPYGVKGRGHSVTLLFKLARHTILKQMQVCITRAETDRLYKDLTSTPLIISIV